MSIEPRGTDNEPPVPELVWLRGLREAASVAPVDAWLLKAIDERVADLRASGGAS